MADKRRSDQVSAAETYADALRRPLEHRKEINSAQVLRYAQALELLDRPETIEERMSRFYQKILDEPVAASDPKNTFGLAPKI